MTNERPSTLRWLYIDFNSYFASVEQQLDPRLRNKPVIVIPVEAETTCAIAASYEAKAFGIRTGTPVHEARKMCPGLICVLGRHDEYVRFHNRILEEIDRHIPVDSVCSIDEMACRLMKNEMTENRVREIAAAIKKGLAENIGPYVRCSIGAAPNRYLAKIATDMQKPDGLVLLQQWDLPHRLYDLKLRDLPGIGENMEIRLRRAGIHDMKTLMSLSASRLRAAWGSIWGEKIWYLLRGQEVPEEATVRRSIGHSHVLAPELRPAERARQTGRRLTLKAAARLRRMKYRTGALSLSVRVESGPRLALETAFPATQDSFALLKIYDALCRDIARELGPRRVLKISITLHRLEAESHSQPDLFAAQAASGPTRGDKISAALDRLNHKFGRDTVTVGLTREQGRSFTGTKIAFTRIPDLEEFVE